MALTHMPPAGLRDFDRGTNPQDLYSKWHQWVAATVAPDPSAPAWYDSLQPPTGGTPATAAPPWQGIPRIALILNNNNVLAAAKTLESPVEFGSGSDPLLVKEDPFRDTAGKPVSGFKYRPHDEYLEWACQRDSDGMIREIWFTCEGPEYWSLIAQNDWPLLVGLYAGILGLPKTSIDEAKLRFSQKLTRIEHFSGSDQPTTFEAGSYNPYNEYNISGAVHLTQGANTLGAEVSLASAGSLIWGNPPKTTDPDLICCASYGSPNRFSDPTIGKEVNDLARQGMYVTLRDPIGLYIASISGNNFTDWDGNQIQNFAAYFVPTRNSDDGSMILRAIFKVPDGVKKNGVQARVGDLKYQGQPIVTGGQVAHAITMHLFAQAMPGAPAQSPQTCKAHPCSAPGHPGFIIPTKIGTPCPTSLNMTLSAHLDTLGRSPKTAFDLSKQGRLSRRVR
jgi:hypothetical protein